MASSDLSKVEIGIPNSVKKSDLNTASKKGILEISLYDGLHEDEKCFAFSYVTFWLVFFVVGSLASINGLVFATEPLQWIALVMYAIYNFGTLSVPKGMTITFRSYNKKLLAVQLFIYPAILVYLSLTIMLIANLPPGPLAQSFAMVGVINAVGYIPMDVRQIWMLRALRMQQKKQVDRKAVNGMISQADYDSAFPPPPTIGASEDATPKAVDDIVVKLSRCMWLEIRIVQFSMITLSFVVFTSVFVAIFAKTFYEVPVFGYWLMNLGVVFTLRHADWTCQFDHIAQSHGLRILYSIAFFIGCLAIIVGTLLIDDNATIQQFGMAGILNGAIFLISGIAVTIKALCQS
jgi:hypothetical protein